MTDDKLTTKLRILYEVEIANWRIGNQEEIKNREWALYVYDRNQEKWCQVSTLNPLTETAVIKHIHIIE